MQWDHIGIHGFHSKQTFSTAALRSSWNMFVEECAVVVAAVVVDLTVNGAGCPTTPFKKGPPVDVCVDSNLSGALKEIFPEIVCCFSVKHVDLIT